MGDEQKRLERALLETVEKMAKEPSEEEYRAIPLVAHELIEFWKITG